MFNDILGSVSEKTLPYSENDSVLANDFAVFFDKKVADIVTNLQVPLSDTTEDDDLDDDRPVPDDILTHFTPISASDVSNIIKSSKKSYNDSDPFPINDIVSAPNFNKIVHEVRLQQPTTPCQLQKPPTNIDRLWLSKTKT